MLAADFMLIFLIRCLVAEWKMVPENKMRHKLNFRYVYVHPSCLKSIPFISQNWHPTVLEFVQIPESAHPLFLWSLYGFCKWKLFSMQLFLGLVSGFRAVVNGPKHCDSTRTSPLLKCHCHCLCVQASSQPMFCPDKQHPGAQRAVFGLIRSFFEHANGIFLHFFKL